LELEIKTAEEALIEEEEGLPSKEKVQQLKPYDPVLDLRDYKFPSLDLLENHGSEKIVQDPAELEIIKTRSLIP
jgi:S-DNA-T family DNA segregation ATPase FtsK/SpoIIIE